MARRPHVEEPENHERWLVSYADFITLLFAFFVVMYSISSVNDGKYRVLSDSLVSAFRKVESTPLSNPLGPTMMVGGRVMQGQLGIKPSVPIKNIKEEEKKRQLREKMRTVAKDLLEALGPLIQEGKVRVTEGIKGVAIEINASLLFAVGDAKLEPQAVKALHAVAEVLARTESPIIVEGHTDPTPIKTAQFPSNWELSGARAASVVRLFVEAGVAPQRLTATGYGEQRPVASNDLAEGRARNRRVAILIEANLPDVPEELAVR